MTCGSPSTSDSGSRPSTASPTGTSRRNRRAAVGPAGREDDAVPGIGQQPAEPRRPPPRRARPVRTFSACASARCWRTSARTAGRSARRSRARRTRWTANRYPDTEPSLDGERETAPARRRDPATRRTPVRDPTRPTRIADEGQLGELLAQVGGPDPVVGEQVAARAGQHELAGLQHVAAVGQRQRLRGVLLDQQHRDPVGVDLRGRSRRSARRSAGPGPSTARRAAAAAACPSAPARSRASAARRRTACRPAGEAFLEPREQVEHPVETVLVRQRKRNAPISRFSATVIRGKTCRPSGDVADARG